MNISVLKMQEINNHFLYRILYREIVTYEIRIFFQKIYGI